MTEQHDAGSRPARLHSLRLRLLAVIILAATATAGLLAFYTLRQFEQASTIDIEHDGRLLGGINVKLSLAVLDDELAETTWTPVAVELAAAMLIVTALGVLPTWQLFRPLQLKGRTRSVLAYELDPGPREPGP